MNKRIAVVGIVGIPGNYGGFETMVENLVDNENISFTVYCSSKNYKDFNQAYGNANLIYIPISANGISSVAYDIVCMVHAILSGHRQILLLGVSGAIFIPIIKFLRLKIKIMTNIDGIEWKRDKWKGLASFFLKFSESLAVRYSDTVIADNEAIGDYVINEYSKKTEIIPYGGNHAFENIQNYNSNISPYDKYFLSVCRIEPENNVDLILKTFSNSESNLIFIGNWNISNYSKNLKTTYSRFENIKLLDPIYDLNTLYFFRKNCVGYIHGHSAGGTNPSLVEIMHFSKPIFAFNCSFNRKTLEENGNYFESASQLEEMISNDKYLYSGQIFKEIANRRYTWDIVKNQYFKLFDEEHK